MTRVRIFNTLTRTKQDFKPMVPGQVKMYICGPTVYDDPHMGHARSAVVFDVVRRYLTSNGYQVTLIRNITDIDDKILQKARRQNQDFRILSTGYIRRYQEAMRRLNVWVPDAEPRASDFVLPIQDFISGLIRRGHAYRSGGNVYFAVQTFQRYGRLSGRTVHLCTGLENASDEIDKKYPADFVLWKAAKAGEPSWPSAWGPGRPGWHIECSAMSQRLLGKVFDIHGGGMDLIFPHHENEIAQSESLSGKTPANYWMHNGFVNAGGRKISKSNGFFQKLNDLLDAFPADAVRLFLLSKRYRHPLEFSPGAIRRATKNLERLNRFFLRPGISPAAAPLEIGIRQNALWDRFCGAMDDDFNFPMALSVIFKKMREIQRKMEFTPVDGYSEESEDLQTAVSDLFWICRNIIGLNLNPNVA